MLFIALQAGRCIQPDGCCWRSCSGSPLAAPPSPHRPVSPLYAPFRGALGTGRAVLTPCPWLLLGLLVVCVPANDLGAAGAEAIAGVLPDCTFPELDLSRCKLGDAGVTAIAAVLPSCPQICRLILEDNQLGAVAGARLADMLPACPHIRELNIQCALLPAWLRRTDGGSSLQPMRRCALAGNHLGPAGAASLAGCLGRQCKLKTLMMARTLRVSHDMSPQQRALPRGVCVCVKETTSVTTGPSHSARCYRRIAP